ncbi:hypothetical protein ACFL5B_03495 [Candidatus Latescibacterota bacterium]
MISGFFKKLTEKIDLIKISATGRMSGHVLTVEPLDTTKKAKKPILDLMGLLTGALVGSGILVFNSILKGSTSQLLGVTGAKPIPHSSEGIALIGYCLQARAKTPEHDERFSLTENDENIPIDRLSKFMKVSDDIIPNVVKEYYFIEKLSELGIDFRQRFNQMGVWILTDNIGFTRIRDNLFPEYMLFTHGPVEIIFWLREILIKSGENIKIFRFDDEFIKVFILNHELGFISDELYVKLQEKFGFNINENI